MISKCRSCKSTKLESVIDLGNQMLSDFRSDDKKPKAYPLHMVRCLDCNFCQLTETAPFDEMYTENYGFKSGTNEVIRKDLKDIVDQARKYVDRYDGDDAVGMSMPLDVLDIASNDGELLSNYSSFDYKVGVDPITKLCKEAESKADLIINEFFPPKDPIPMKFDIITAISCFYDVEDPLNFISEMVKLLKDDGVLTIQQNYILATLENNAYDNVCLAKGELVTTINGNKKIEDIEEGELVLTHTGKFRKVLKKFVTPNNDKEMIRLRAYGAGYDLNVTKNHPIYVQRGGKWSFIPAEEVNINDIVGKSVVNEYPEYTDKVKINSNTGKISGYYLAEGSYFKQKKGGNVVNFYFNKNEKDTHIAELVKCLHDEGYSANLFHPKGSSVIVVTTYGEIAEWLFKNFKHHALNKTIPMWIHGQSRDFMESLMTSYFNGDGYDYRRNQLRGSTVSKDLAYGISLLANQLGFKCSITECKRDPNGNILGRDVNIHNLWDILVHTKPEKKMKVWMETGIQCMRVRKIEAVTYEEKSVYNLEVEEDNSYVTPAMTVHNCHEHIGYHSLLSMEYLFDKCGLECVDVSTSMVNGGVLRTVCQKKGVGTPTKAVQAQRDYEKAFGLDTDKPYTKFRENVESTAKELKKLIDSINAVGKKCYIYGASTRGGTIWQYVGLDVKDLPFAVERNPEKIGKKIAAIGVPIISEEQARLDKPDYMLVSIWFFSSSVLKREVEYIKNGGHLIFPLPDLTII